MPLIKFWLGRISGVGDEWDDLAQDVLVVLLRELSGFTPQGMGSFRGWLRTITINQTRAFFKKRRRRPVVGLAAGDEDFLAQLEDPNSELARKWDEDHDRHVSQKLLQLVKGDFEPATWEAFSRFALEARPAASVAQELGISENAVLLAKSRVMKRLRREAAGLLT